MAAGRAEFGNSDFRGPGPLQTDGRKFRIEHRKRNYSVRFGYGERCEFVRR